MRPFKKKLINNFLKHLGTVVFSELYSNKNRFVGDYFQPWINAHLVLREMYGVCETEPK